MQNGIIETLSDLGMAAKVDFPQVSGFGRQLPMTLSV